MLILCFRIFLFLIQQLFCCIQLNFVKISTSIWFTKYSNVESLFSVFSSTRNSMQIIQSDNVIKFKWWQFFFYLSPLIVWKRELILYAYIGTLRLNEFFHLKWCWHAATQILLSFPNESQVRSLIRAFQSLTVTHRISFTFALNSNWKCLVSHERFIL